MQWCCRGSQQLELQPADSVYLCVFSWVETEVLLLQNIVRQHNTSQLHHQHQQQQPHHYRPWKLHIYPAQLV